MAFLPRTNIASPISPRQPEEKSLLDVVQKELWPFFQQVRRAVNWAASWIGLIQVDATDTPGTLVDKANPGSGVFITKTGSDGNRQLTFSADTGTIVTNIVNNPVTVQTITNVVTNTVQASPGTVASTLYPARIDNPLYRGEAKGLLQYGEDGAVLTQTTGISTWFVGGGNGQLYLRDSSADPTIPANDGDLVGYWLPGLVPSSPTRAHLGLYKVLDCGHHWDGNPMHAPINTVPMIARVTTANAPTGLCHGSVWSVANGTAAYAGYSFTLGTADPIVVDTTLLSFTAAAGFTPANAYELLTGPQLSSEHASSDPLSIQATIASGDADMQGFQTIAGTPGLSALPAGPWTFNNELVYLYPLLPPSPGSVTTLRWRILKDPGAVELFHADSPPLTMVAGPLSFQYNDSGHSLSPTDTLVAIPTLHTTSTTPVQLILLAQSASRLTNIVAPVQLPVNGASDGVHNHLTGRDKDVGSSDTANTDPCHPACALGDGLMQIGAHAVTTSGGYIPAVTSNTLLVTAAADSSYIVRGMGTAGLKSGTHFWIVCMNPCSIAGYDGEVTPPTGFAQFVLDTDGDGHQNSIDWLSTPMSPGRFGVIYFATELTQSPCFLMTEGAII